MDKRNDIESWIAEQIRFAGEELIRRSEKIDFSGMDLLSDIHIDIDIPADRESIEIPLLTLSFKCFNKTFVDDYIKR